MRCSSFMGLVLLLAAAAVAVGAGTTEWWAWTAEFPDGTGSPLLNTLTYRATFSLYRLCVSRAYEPGGGRPADSDGCSWVGVDECPQASVPFTADGSLVSSDCGMFHASRGATAFALAFLVGASALATKRKPFAALTLTMLGAAATCVAAATFYKWTPGCSLDGTDAELTCEPGYSLVLVAGGAAVAGLAVLGGMYSACHPNAGATAGDDGAAGAAGRNVRQRDLYFGA